jgi:hypothetical protein
MCGSILGVILYFIINWLMNHIGFVDSLLSNKVVFFIFMTIASGEVGRRTALIIMSIFAKHMEKSVNIGKGVLGAGIILIIYSVIVGIISLLNGAQYLDLSLGVLGLWYVLFGGVSEDDAGDSQISKPKIDPPPAKQTPRAKRGMSDDQIKGYADYIVKNCNGVELPIEEAEFFVRNVLNRYELEGKQAVLSAFESFNHDLQKLDPQYWTAKHGFYTGLLISNEIITDEESDALSEKYVNDFVNQMKADAQRERQLNLKRAVVGKWDEIIKFMPGMYLACLRNATPVISPENGQLYIQFMDNTVMFLCEDDAFKNCLDTAIVNVLGEKVDYDLISQKQYDGSNQSSSVYGMDVSVDDQDFV